MHMKHQGRSLHVCVGVFVLVRSFVCVRACVLIVPPYSDAKVVDEKNNNKGLIVMVQLFQANYPVGLII